jgi:monoterpene epsilon-lactone hydrolase
MIPLSLPEVIVAWFLRTFLKPFLSPRFPVRFQRRWLDVASFLNLPPRGVRRTATTLGGVPTVVLAPAGVALDGAPDRPVVLYLHGGAFVLGGRRTHQSLAGFRAKSLGGPVHLVDYRLAPEHPYPAAADDVAAAYTWLTTRTRPDRLAVVAESSGCGLLLSALHRIRQAGDPSVLPGRIVLLSPAVDLEGRYVDQLDADNPHSQLLRELVERSQTTYLDGHSATDPSINALYDDLAGLPTILVQAGAQDFCLHDARELVARARDHGVEAHLELYPVATHVFHHYWSFLPEASRALHRASAFINS